MRQWLFENDRERANIWFMACTITVFLYCFSNVLPGPINVDGWMERIEKWRSDQPVKPPVSGSTQPPFDDDTGVHPFDGRMRASELIGQQNCSVRVDIWWIATMSWLVSHWINIWSNSNKHTHTLAKYPRASKHSTRAPRPETIVTNRHVEWARASPSAGRYHPMGSGWRCGGVNGGWMGKYTNTPFTSSCPKDRKHRGKRSESLLELVDDDVERYSLTPSEPTRQLTIEIRFRCAFVQFGSVPKALSLEWLWLPGLACRSLLSRRRRRQDARSTRKSREHFHSLQSNTFVCIIIEWRKEEKWARKSYIPALPGDFTWNQKKEDDRAEEDE